MLRKVLVLLVIVLVLVMVFALESAGAFPWQQRPPQQLQLQRRPQAAQLRTIDLAPGNAPVRASFNLGATFGSRHRIDLTIPRPGNIHLQVSWTGSARQLAVILNGPGQTAAYARVDGASPRVLDFAVTQAMVDQGREWQVSIVNFGDGSASVTVTGQHPAQSERLDLSSATVRSAWKLDEKVRLVGPAAPDDDAPREPVRTILDDGTVEIQYPDGTIQRFPPGCGWTIIRPDGTVLGTQCAEVQGTALPELPSDLTDEELNGWLNSLADRLIFTIGTIVNDDEALQNYLTLEEGKPLLERIDLRAEALEHLMAPAPGGF